MIENRVRRYLVRILSTYPKTFYNNMCGLWLDITGMYVWDQSYYDVKGIEFMPYLFIEIKSKSANSHLIKEACGSSHVVDSYPTKTGIMVVIQVIPEWLPTYKQFLLSRYSQMYDAKSLKRVGVVPVSSGKPNIVHGILTKTDLGLSEFCKVLLANFGTPVTPEDMRNSPEYDLSICGDDILGDFTRFKNMIKHIT